MRISRILISLIFLLVVGFAVLEGGGIAWFATHPMTKDAESSADYIIEVKRGMSPREIARQLEQGGVVSSARQLFWVGRLTGKWQSIKAGEYKVSARMTPIEVLQVIASGVSVAHPFTVREGENLYEIAAGLESRAFGTRATYVALCKDESFIRSVWTSLGFEGALPPTLEGYLFPDTYHFNKTMTPQEILKKMVRRFSSEWGQAQQERASRFGMSRHQVLTLASMIEKETGAGHERPLISSVFHNRLKKRMRLQSDPTTIYGIWEQYQGNIRKSDLQTQNPYNTYWVPALPAGPIGNPGREAIEAALSPEPSEYLYFVSHNDGTHEFTRTYEDHLSAVRKFQLDRNAREGKSWRDLNKKSKAVTPVQVTR